MAASEIIWAQSCLVPISMVNSRLLCKCLVEELLYEKIQSVVGDRSTQDYFSLLSDAVNNSQIICFNKSSDRLDTFFFDIIGCDSA